MDAQAQNDNLSQSQDSWKDLFKDKRVVIGIVVGVLLLIAMIVAIVIATQPKDTAKDSNSNKNTQNQQNNQNQNQNQTSNELPANTCPESLTTSNGKQVAIYKGKETQMSKEVADWVKLNCTFGSAEKPVLNNLAIKFGDYSSATGKAGDLVMNKSTIMQNWGMNKLLIEFGGTFKDGVQISPELSFMQIDPNASVISMADGTVFNAEYQAESNDYGVEIRYNDNWMIIYDHVAEFKLKKGDKVQTGTILGKPSKNKDGKTGYLELMVKEGSGQNKGKFHCPVSLLSPEAKVKYEAELKEVMKDWETVYGDQTIYNESKQSRPGCVVDSYEDTGN